MILPLVDEALASGARLCAVCKQLGLSARSLQRWRVRGPDGGQDMRRGPESGPPNALSEAERAAVVETANLPEFRDLSPRQIVPKLADRGVYLASESTFYRVLEAEGQNEPAPIWSAHSSHRVFAVQTCEHHRDRRNTFQPPAKCGGTRRPT
ncbi:MAG: hypothetical protein RL385_2683 [Pseudomonadota bacterium]